jgi:hypothetical protein
MHEDELNREEERQRRKKGLQILQKLQDPMKMAYDEGERRFARIEQQLAEK